MVNGLDELLNALFIKHNIFVSYHHGLDQDYYNFFSSKYSYMYGIFHDNSLDRKIDSENTNYVMWRIRQYYIKGTSCTVVLCGALTRWRKYVDWEIKASLDKKNGLIGIILPNNPRDLWGRVNIPDRLYDNIITGYALSITWEELLSSNTSLKLFIDEAINRPKAFINNSRSLRRRNG